MSCPELELHIASTATLSAVGTFLCTELTEQKEGEDSHSIQRLGDIGPISIYSLRVRWIDYGDYQAHWNLILSFGGPYRWWEIRFQLVLQLCADLHQKYGGTYLGRYDTGSVAFYLKDETIFFPQQEKAYLSQFPVPFASHAFADLSPV